jgi:hypothetical protein
VASPINCRKAHLVLNFYVSTGKYQVLDDLYPLKRSGKHECSLVCFVRGVNVNAIMDQERAQAVEITGSSSTQKLDGGEAHESG